jgi:hypothetical protein
MVDSVALHGLLASHRPSLANEATLKQTLSHRYLLHPHDHLLHHQNRSSKKRRRQQRRSSNFRRGCEFERDDGSTFDRAG